MFALSNTFKLFVVFFNERTRGRLTSLTLPLFIEVPVPRQESDRSCICVQWISILPLCTILIFYFGIVVTSFFFSLYIYVFSFLFLRSNKRPTQSENPIEKS